MTSLSNSSVVFIVASACCCLEIEMISQCTFFFIFLVSRLELQLTVSFCSANLPEPPPGFSPPLAHHPFKSSKKKEIKQHTKKKN